MLVYGEGRQIPRKARPNHVTLYLSEGDRANLKELAKAKGYVVKRGPHVGKGGIGKLMQALARGELTAIKLGSGKG